MKNENAAIYELWEDHNGYTLFDPLVTKSEEHNFSPEAKKIWSVKACSLEEASAKMDEYLGWNVKG
jgi:hypothetical protein